MRYAPLPGVRIGREKCPKCLTMRDVASWWVSMSGYEHVEHKCLHCLHHYPNYVEGGHPDLLREERKWREKQDGKNIMEKVKIGMRTVTEIANNENNVILKLDDGTIIENRFMEMDGVFYCVMFEMRYWNKHSASLVETGKVFKKTELGDTKKEARKYWDSLVRHKGFVQG